MKQLFYKALVFVAIKIINKLIENHLKKDTKNV